MSDMWIKLVLTGMNAIIGSLQGRISADSISFSDGIERSLPDQLNLAIRSKQMIKLFDPIQLHPVPSPSGTSTMTIPLIQALEPKITEEFIWINAGQIQWWGEMECDEKWQQIVDQSIHGVAVPEAGMEIDEPEDDGGSNIIHLPGR